MLQKDLSSWAGFFVSARKNPPLFGWCFKFPGKPPTFSLSKFFQVAFWAIFMNKIFDFGPFWPFLKSNFLLSKVLKISKIFFEIFR